MKRDSNFTSYFPRDKNLSTNYIRNLFANGTAVARWLCFETQESSLYGIFISPLKFTQPFENLRPFFAQPRENPFSYSPLLEISSCLTLPRVALHELRLVPELL